MNDLSKKESMTRALTKTIEVAPVLLPEETKQTEYNKIPISRLSSLGVGFQPLVQAFERYAGNGTGIYRVTVPQGAHLATLHSGAGNIGTTLSNTTNQISGQAVLNPLELDPTMMFMAVALANIDKKLDDIQATQKEMFDFLKQKEKSEVRGNLQFLADITENYKHNWDNALYKSSNHVKVLDIKQDAEQKIDFYRGQINDKVSKRNFIHIDSDVKKQIDDLHEYFKDYHLALYMYAYAAFLEIMLLENYSEKYLTNISKKIEDYSIQYRELYTTCFNQIEDYQKTSVQSVLLKGLSKASTASGKFIEKVPVISKSQLDEGLIEAGNQLSDFSKRNAEKVLDKFIEKEQQSVRPFRESIETINKIYNNDLSIAFDNKNIYLSAL